MSVLECLPVVSIYIPAVFRYKPVIPKKERKKNFKINFQLVELKVNIKHNSTCALDVIESSFMS